MPMPLTVSCSSKIQIGFTFLVPAYTGFLEKRPLNGCLSVLKIKYSFIHCRRCHSGQCHVKSRGMRSKTKLLENSKSFNSKDIHFTRLVPRWTVKHIITSHRPCTLNKNRYNTRPLSAFEKLNNFSFNFACLIYVLYTLVPNAVKRYGGNTK